jgi:hypothetical protein
VKPVEPLEPLEPLENDGPDRVRARSAL